ncbi:autotransporter outer membrane beta-barrel domain-containing protein [Helicobacter mustelae]|uniref:Putative autotransporter protein n=1 Tax=Helicobacter mustelae (strain ATCC 43772 / CCUG 25715 / CIP 103759 / LMG 18044 / NCTC 12198 / R85-136P) TaxID=679897 RepID=D3UFV9_HELM1|nr:autotransporter outer membrane beta-barrel domain-containing protein [Helicobacter mustelae]CBG39380.1 putative autotransporter protein [Helicobacter mustelae 12198]SQH70893.1 autotransporter protein [Helicobacter mustelae]
MNKKFHQPSWAEKTWANSSTNKNDCTDIANAPSIGYFKRPLRAFGSSCFIASTLAFTLQTALAQASTTTSNAPITIDSDKKEIPETINITTPNQTAIEFKPTSATTNPITAHLKQNTSTVTVTSSVTTGTNTGIGLASDAQSDVGLIITGKNNTTSSGGGGTATTPSTSDGSILFKGFKAGDKIINFTGGSLTFDKVSIAVDGQSTTATQPQARSADSSAGASGGTLASGASYGIYNGPAASSGGSGSSNGATGLIYNFGTTTFTNIQGKEGGSAIGVWMANNATFSGVLKFANIQGGNGTASSDGGDAIGIGNPDAASSGSGGTQPLVTAKSAPSPTTSNPKQAVTLTLNNAQASFHLVGGNGGSGTATEGSATVTAATTASTTTGAQNGNGGNAIGIAGSSASDIIVKFGNGGSVITPDVAKPDSSQNNSLTFTLTGGNGGKGNGGNAIGIMINQNDRGVVLNGPGKVIFSQLTGGQKGSGENATAGNTYVIDNQSTRTQSNPPGSNMPTGPVPGSIILEGGAQIIVGTDPSSTGSSGGSGSDTTTPYAAILVNDTGKTANFNFGEGGATMVTKLHQNSSIEGMELQSGNANVTGNFAVFGGHVKASQNDNNRENAIGITVGNNTTLTATGSGLNLAVIGGTAVSINAPGGSANGLHLGASNAIGIALKGGTLGGGVFKLAVAGGNGAKQNTGSNNGGDAIALLNEGNSKIENSNIEIKLSEGNAGIQVINPVATTEQPVVQEHNSNDGIAWALQNQSGTLTLKNSTLTVGRDSTPSVRAIIADGGGGDIYNFGTGENKTIASLTLSQPTTQSLASSKDGAQQTEPTNVAAVVINTLSDAVVFQGNASFSVTNDKTGDAYGIMGSQKEFKPTPPAAPPAPSAPKAPAAVVLASDPAPAAPDAKNSDPASVLVFGISENSTKDNNDASKVANITFANITAGNGNSQTNSKNGGQAVGIVGSQYGSTALIFENNSTVTFQNIQGGNGGSGGNGGNATGILVGTNNKPVVLSGQGKIIFSQLTAGAGGANEANAKAGTAGMTYVIDNQTTQPASPPNPPKAPATQSDGNYGVVIENGAQIVVGTTPTEQNQGTDSTSPYTGIIVNTNANTVSNFNFGKATTSNFDSGTFISSEAQNVSTIGMDVKQGKVYAKGVLTVGGTPTGTVDDKTVTGIQLSGGTLTSASPTTESGKQADSLSVYAGGYAGGKAPAQENGAITVTAPGAMVQGAKMAGQDNSTATSAAAGNGNGAAAVGIAINAGATLGGGTFKFHAQGGNGGSGTGNGGNATGIALEGGSIDGSQVDVIAIGGNGAKATSGTNGNGGDAIAIANSGNSTIKNAIINVNIAAGKEGSQVQDAPKPQVTPPQANDSGTSNSQTSDKSNSSSTPSAQTKGDQATNSADTSPSSPPSPARSEDSPAPQSQVNSVAQGSSHDTQASGASGESGGDSTQGAKQARSTEIVLAANTAEKDPGIDAGVGSDATPPKNAAQDATAGKNGLLYVIKNTSGTLTLQNSSINVPAINSTQAANNPPKAIITDNLGGDIYDFGKSTVASFVAETDNLAAIVLGASTNMQGNASFSVHSKSGLVAGIIANSKATPSTPGVNAVSSGNSTSPSTQTSPLTLTLGASTDTNGKTTPATLTFDIAGGNTASTPSATSAASPYNAYGILVKEHSFNLEGKGDIIFSNVGQNGAIIAVGTTVPGINSTSTTSKDAVLPATTTGATLNIKEGVRIIAGSAPSMPRGSGRIGTTVIYNNLSGTSYVFGEGNNSTNVLANGTGNSTLTAFGAAQSANISGNLEVRNTDSSDSPNGTGTFTGISISGGVEDTVLNIVGATKVSVNANPATSTPAPAPQTQPSNQGTTGSSGSTSTPTPSKPAPQADDTGKDTTKVADAAGKTSESQPQSQSQPTAGSTDQTQGSSTPEVKSSDQTQPDPTKTIALATVLASTTNSPINVVGIETKGNGGTINLDANLIMDLTGNTATGIKINGGALKLSAGPASTTGAKTGSTDVRQLIIHATSTKAGSAGPVIVDGSVGTLIVGKNVSIVGSNNTSAVSFSTTAGNGKDSSGSTGSNNTQASLYGNVANAQFKLGNTILDSNNYGIYAAQNTNISLAANTTLNITAQQAFGAANNANLNVALVNRSVIEIHGQGGTINTLSSDKDTYGAVVSLAGNKQERSINTTFRTLTIKNITANHVDFKVMGTTKDLGTGKNNAFASIEDIGKTTTAAGTGKTQGSTSTVVVAGGSDRIIIEGANQNSTASTPNGGASDSTKAADSGNGFQRISVTQPGSFSVSGALATPAPSATQTPANVLNETLSIGFINANSSSKSPQYAVLAEVKNGAANSVIFNGLNKQGDTTKITSIQGFDQGIFTLGRKDVNGNAYYYTNLADRTISLMAGARDATLAALASGYQLYLANINSLNKRLGELRNNPNANGLWIRLFNGEQVTRFAVDSKSLYTTLQGGYDYAFGSEGANNYLGFAISYANAITSTKNFVFENQVFGLKDGNSNALEIALYNSYVQDGASKDTKWLNGFYSDSVIKLSIISTSLQMQGQNNKYNTNNAAFTFSEEIGYRFLLGENNEWYITPQGEVALGYFNSNQFTQALNNNTLFGKQEAIITVRTRAGASFGYKFDKFTEGKGFKSEIYLGTFYRGTYISGGQVNLVSAYSATTLTPFVSGNGFLLNLGTNFLIKDHHRVYIDLERSFGGSFITNYQFNVGYRYSFGENKDYKPIITTQTNHVKKDEAKDAGEREQEQEKETHPLDENIQSTHAPETPSQDAPKTKEGEKGAEGSPIENTPTKDAQTPAEQ